MKILVVGGGGREHALAWRLAASPRVAAVLVAPGNGGTARDPRLRNVGLTDPAALAEFAAREGIGLTVVGPEGPLAAGIVDRFRAHGLRIFGPTRAAAQLESSKDFAKTFMVRHGIPTAAHRTFTDAAQARAWVSACGAPIVVKADGLAAGKGVVVANTVAQAHAAIDLMLLHDQMGSAGARVVIEAFLDGEEASFIVMCDGRHALALATAQDHKRLRDGDQGPNTGGMGAVSPAPGVTPALHARILREIIEPTLAGMAAEGIEYTGFLYAGVMIGTDGEPRVLEFNCRLGDPEAQPILMRLRSDPVDLLEAAIDGELARLQDSVEWDRRCAVGVVLAAAGYPETPRLGDAIERLPADTDACVMFHAGTTVAAGGLVTSGGRVLCATALGDTVAQARQRAYAAADAVRCAGVQMRRDIGQRALRPRPDPHPDPLPQAGEGE
jgi:phosphoribosylamine---glycine ligase